MDNDPIFETSFWKDRLNRAKARGLVHQSVYLAEPGLWKRIEESHENIIAKVIPKKAKVLDAACGYGRLAPLFDKYTGVDFSPELLEEAKTLFPDKTFILGDLRNLPFKDKEFGWAVAASVKHMIVGRKGMDVWKECEKELKRVAKKVLILEYGAGATVDHDYEIL